MSGTGRDSQRTEVFPWKLVEGGDFSLKKVEKGHLKGSGSSFMGSILFLQQLSFFFFFGFFAL